MEGSIFTDRTKAPTAGDLKMTLGTLYASWAGLVEFVMQQHPAVFEEWNYSKLGWNCRIKDKKRVIIYLMPGDNQFMASLVLGEKASKQVLAANITKSTKEIIEASPVYAEGRGVRIIVSNKKLVDDIKTITGIKLASW